MLLGVMAPTSKPLFALALLAGVAASNCSEEPSGEPGDPAMIETSVSGLVWRNGPVAEAVVTVRDAQGSLNEDRTDSAGRFDIALGPVRGDIEVVSGGLRQRVFVGEVGESVDDILLSPAGTLAEAYVDSFAPGSREEKLEVVTSFFQIPLTGDTLSSFDVQLGTSCNDFEDPAIGPAALAGILQAGFRHAGESIVSETSIGAIPDDLLQALVRDLASDGFLDGVGADGEPLAFAGLDLDALIMRPRYVNAMTAFLRSGQNRSGLDAACFRRFFDDILFSQSVLFPASTWIAKPFRTGCASCVQLQNGDFSCEAVEDCGPCGQCSIDLSGVSPTASCVAQELVCTGNCDTCTAMTGDPEKFACVADAEVCSGNCSSCVANGDGGFSCQPDTDQCLGSCGACVQDANDATVFECLPQPSECRGNCNLCEAVTGETPGFECVTDPSICGGNCASCAADGDGGFSCQANRDRCVGGCGACIQDANDATVFECLARPDACEGNCSQCQAVSGETPGFACVANDSACSGNCSMCASDGAGGFSCRADTSQCIGDCAACTQEPGNNTVFQCLPQPSACRGNCNECEPVTGGTPGFVCESNDSICSGNCSMCASDGAGGFSCQADRSQCIGNCAACTQDPGNSTVFQCLAQPAACRGNCNECEPVTGGTPGFVCESNDSICSGNCSMCASDGAGGFSCQADTSRCIGNCAACTQDPGNSTVFRCLAQPASCRGNCNQCERLSGETPGFACETNDSICGGNCSMCASDGAGGFSCQADLQQCSGNCVACSASPANSTDFSCAPRPSACVGDCALCLGGGQAFSCQGDIALCPGPNDTRCNECRELNPNMFRCEDIREQCPADVETVLTDCENPNSVCGLTGTEIVQRQLYQCNQGTCTESVDSILRACQRDTDGIDCGDLQCSTPFSECEQVSSSDLCSQVGDQSRTCQQPICLGGFCGDDRPVVQRRSCFFNSDGLFCDRRSCGVNRQRSYCCSEGECNLPCGICEG